MIIQSAMSFATEMVAHDFIPREQAIGRAGVGPLRRVTLAEFLHDFDNSDQDSESAEADIDSDIDS